jgi:hypothetical protein
MIAEQRMLNGQRRALYYIPGIIIVVIAIEVLLQFCKTF